MARLYNEGFLQRELRAQFHCNIATVREILIGQNVTIRGNQQPAYTPTREEIKAGMAKIRRLGGMAPAELTPDYDWSE